MGNSHELRPGERGAGLLIEHCVALDRLDEARTSARARLEASLGDDLTRLLVGALTTAERPLAIEDAYEADPAA